MYHPDKVLVAVSLSSESIEKMVGDGKNIMSGPDIERPNILEARVDYLPVEELTKEGIKYLTQELAPTPLIITPRHVSEIPPGDTNAGFKGSEIERAEVFQNAIKAGADYIDMEYLRAFDIDLAESKTKVILSNHNFHHTPSLHALVKLYRKMHRSMPDALIKIVTRSLSFEDNYRILRFIEDSSSHQNLIAIGTGEIGRDTRVKGPLLGSLITYACSSALSSTAPGQMTVGQLRKSMRKEYFP